MRKSGTSATQNIDHKNNVKCLLNNLFVPLMKKYKKNYNSEIPVFFQNFILSEMTWYIINKIDDIKFTFFEKNEIENLLKYIIKNINISVIENSDYIDEFGKGRVLYIKADHKFLSNKNYVKNTEPKSENKLYKPKSENMLYETKEILLIPIKKLILQILKPAYGEIDYLRKETLNYKADIEILKEKLANNKNEIIDSIQQSIKNHENELMQIKNISNEIKKDININSKEILGIKKDININSKEILGIKKDINININEIVEIKKDIDFYPKEKIKYLLYFHGGSDNRGCEALTKTIIKTLNTNSSEQLLFSFRKSDDLNANLNSICKYIYEPIIKDKRENLSYMGNSVFSLDDMGLSEVDKVVNENTIALSIGGDNYCYGEYVANILSSYNLYFKNKNIKTALVGCSIEPDVLDNENILSDLKEYDLIIARESITYDALIDAGINNNTHLVPDTAFDLETINLDLPDNFIEGKTIGINMSPLILEKDDGEVIYNNYYNLIKYIIEETEYNVALIPHVFWEKSNDFLAMVKLYDSFVATRRISIIGKHSSEELKGYISRCEIFVGARTHATIAAYSSCVPTLVVGYSVKSKGIAKDIFGTYENYVVPLEDFVNERILIESFNYILEKKDEIKKYLLNKIPEYKKEISKFQNLIESLNNKIKLPYINCTGCTACKNICPTKCIDFKDNSEGFSYPNIDKNKCISCNECLNVCPVLNSEKNDCISEAYAVINKNSNELIQSSSGGFFSVLAKKILNENGIVYGAAFDKNMKVKHIEITNIKELNNIRGSKYVQSNLNDTFLKVREKLNKNILVLFSGTPCQVKGLNRFLDKDYKNLITVDLACHGVPSPKVFKKYITDIEKQKNSKIIEYNFRNKDIGWKKFNTKIKLKNKEIINEYFGNNIYMKGFLQNLYLRKSCYNCTSNNFTSKSDFTLADFWGVEDVKQNMDNHNGVSLVLLNTEKAKITFKNDNMQKLIDFCEVNLNEAIKYNSPLIKPAINNKNREIFFKNINKKNITDNITENLM